MYVFVNVKVSIFIWDNAVCGNSMAIIFPLAALSITVDTTIHTATVYFSYENPINITKFNATIPYLDSYYEYKYDGCSLEVTTTPWRCSIQNIYEAVDFNVLARACNEEECESPVVM